MNMNTVKTHATRDLTRPFMGVSAHRAVRLAWLFATATACDSMRRYRRPQDHETALSAVRNLNGQDVGGRPLRIDLADSDPFLEGKTTVRGEIIDGGETRAQWRERQHERERAQDGFMRQLPQGVPLPPGTNAMDHISNVLATTQPSQILEVLAQMKVCARRLRLLWQVNSVGT